jgi:hypothetical protein
MRVSFRAGADRPESSFLIVDNGILAKQLKSINVEPETSAFSVYELLGVADALVAVYSETDHSSTEETLAAFVRPQPLPFVRTGD